MDNRWSRRKASIRSHTLSSVNRRLDAEREARLTEILERDEGLASCSQRLRELESEWEVERALTALIGVGSLAATLLARNRGGVTWLLPAIGGLVLIEQALTGGSALLALMRRAGLRTRREIDVEMYALKGLRGDFLRIPQSGGARVRANAAVIAAES